jgi:hypothetical protein
LKKLVKDLRLNQNIEQEKPKEQDLETGRVSFNQPQTLKRLKEADLEELYDQADGKAAIRRPTIINEYDNVRLNPADDDKEQKSAVT